MEVGAAGASAGSLGSIFSHSFCSLCLHLERGVFVESIEEWCACARLVLFGVRIMVLEFTGFLSFLCQPFSVEFRACQCTPLEFRAAFS